MDDARLPESGLAQLPLQQQQQQQLPSQELPIRLRASTNVDGSRPAYYRVTARSWDHLVQWASQRTDFNPLKDFFRYEDEDGLDVFVTDESDFREAIVALRSKKEANQQQFFLPAEQQQQQQQRQASPLPPFQSNQGRLEKTSSTRSFVQPLVPGKSPSPQPASPRSSSDRLELWVVKKTHSFEYLYRCSESLREIANFVNEHSPSSVERIHGFVEYRSSANLEPNVLVSTTESTMESRSLEAYSRVGDSNESSSLPPSPVLRITSEVGVTRSFETLDETKDDFDLAGNASGNNRSALVYHAWVARDESGEKYRFRVGSFESVFGCRDSIDVKVFPQFCFGLIPITMRYVFARASVNINVKDLCLFVEQVSERDLDREDYGLGIVAGYGAREGVFDDDLRPSSPAASRSTGYHHQPAPSSSSNALYPDSDKEHTPFARRIVSAPPQSSVFPPSLGKLPSSGNVFGDEPSYKSRPNGH